MFVVVGGAEAPGGVAAAIRAPRLKYRTMMPHMAMSSMSRWSTGMCHFRGRWMFGAWAWRKMSTATAMNMTAIRAEENRVISWSVNSFMKQVCVE